LNQILRVNAARPAGTELEPIKARRVNRAWQAPDGEKAASGNAETAFEAGKCGI
jgi:hypothetical protein